MIRAALTAWRDVTEKLVRLTQETAVDRRDETIAGIEALLDDRDKLQPHITAPFTPEEEVFGKSLVATEADVEKQLAQFTKLIRTDIAESQAKKDNMKNYVNPYGNVARDGTFYDTKQ